MHKHLKTDLSVEGIEQLKAEIERYKESLLSKEVEFLHKLADLGIEIIDANYIAAPETSAAHSTSVVTIDATRDTYTIQIRVSGDDLLFVEFGAGTFYNGAVGSSPHPKGAELGMTIGDYGYKQGRRSWWRTPEGTLTHGQPAMMPVQKADEAIIKAITEIAQQIWGE